MDHKSNFQLIEDTEPFLIEHSRLSEHDDIKEKVKNMLETFETTFSAEKVGFP